mmetsp:Transcript_29112/g.57049  ORF Transcript_29112/g.57049 Transcript_29112/m.57049 type:complete len:170 (-) Transcript_29112:304-813(-)
MKEKRFRLSEVQRVCFLEMCKLITGSLFLYGGRTDTLASPPLFIHLIKPSSVPLTIFRLPSLRREEVEVLRNHLTEPAYKSTTTKRQRNLHCNSKDKARQTERKHNKSKAGGERAKAKSLATPTYREVRMSSCQIVAYTCWSLAHQQKAPATVCEASRLSFSASLLPLV